MKEERFFWSWVGLFLGIFILALIVISTVIIVFKLSALFFLVLIIWPPVFIYLVWKNRLVVSPEWSLIWEWASERMQPLGNGYHYPFRYFGLFREIAEMPVNTQILYVLSGTRKELDPEIISKYVYGNASNIEPKTGDVIRLQYEIGCICENPLKAAYLSFDPYERIVKIVESNIGIYVHEHDNKEVNDGFNLQTLNSILLPDTIAKILAETGFRVTDFTPIDIINTPEVEAQNRKNGQIEQEKIDIKNTTKNDVLREQGRKKVLEVRLANRTVVENIAKKDDQILANSVNSLKKEAGINGSEALKVILKKKTLDTVAEAAQSGSITYIDESGNQGNLGQASALSFALSSSNNQKKS